MTLDDKNIKARVKAIREYRKWIMADPTGQRARDFLARVGIVKDGKLTKEYGGEK
jgi:hypothetical protein